MRKNQFVVILLTAMLVVACGNDNGEDVAPPASTIQFQPAGIEFASYFGTNRPSTLGPEFVTVTVLNPTGNPVKGASVAIFNDGDNSIMSSNKAGNFLSLQTEPYVAKSDDFGNVYFYIFSTPITTPDTVTYDLQAFSGGARGEMPITITCEDVNTATVDVCD